MDDLRSTMDAMWESGLTIADGVTSGMRIYFAIRGGFGLGVFMSLS